MAKTYSQDLRDRVLAAYDDGMQTKQIAETFKVSRAWARRVKQTRRETGRTSALPRGGARVVKIDLQRLAELVHEQPDATLRELRDRLAVQCCETSVCRAPARLNLTVKKTIHAAEQDRSDVAEQRRRWKARQGERDARRLIFIDETWAKTNMTRLRGRAQRGQRLREKVPHGHWKTTTLIAALGLEGIRCSTVVDGAVNGDIFEAFVEHVLVPVLRPGDVVVMDNLSSHKRHRTRQLIEAEGAELLFLPPYSPDLNPIELVFSKVKQRLRSLACRSREALWRAMQAVLDTVTAADTINCYRHCGYRYE